MRTHILSSSSPAKAGDPVFQRCQRLNRGAAAYWMPAFAGMTAETRSETALGRLQSKSVLIRLDRQRFILRPFAHRAVIEREVVVTEPVEQEQVDGGGDTAAAIGDHALVPSDALRREFLLRVRQRHEGFCLGIEQCCRRYIAASGNAPGPAVAAGLETPVELRSERIDDDGVAPLARGQNLVPVDEISGLRLCCERRRRISLGGDKIDRAALR